MELVELQSWQSKIGKALADTKGVDSVGLYDDVDFLKQTILDVKLWNDTPDVKKAVQNILEKVGALDVIYRYSKVPMHRSLVKPASK